MSDELRAAEAVLRPSAEAIGRAWLAMVTAEREQVERLPNRPRPEDFYGPVAGVFRADPRRTDEPLLDRLLELVRPGETWIDLGAGGGRYALPIALKAATVYAVEPSEGMRRVLTESAAEHAITNVEVYDERWPSPSRVPAADVCLICHVGYDIADIRPFVEQMEAHAGSRCVAVLFERAPISDFAPLWRPVHGEDRVLLPGMREFVALLFAEGRAPAVELLAFPPRLYTGRDHLQAAARRPLWVLEGSAEDEALGKAVAALAVEVEGGVALSARRRRLGIITWEPR